jgi:hypothetical protein
MATFCAIFFQNSSGHSDRRMLLQIYIPRYKKVFEDAIVEYVAGSNHLRVARVTRWVCEAIAQNAALRIFLSKFMQDFYYGKKVAKI